MKTSSIRRTAQVALGSALLVSGFSASAATWSLANGVVTNPGGAAPNATASGWSITNASSGVINSGSTFAAATLTNQGGSGAGMTTAGESTLSPNHAIDNSGSTELVSLKFGSAIKLESVTLGWSSTDSDISVLAYTGAGAQPASISGLSVAGLLSSGWTLVGSYANLATGVANTVTNAGNVSSSWWLVSAYNSGFGSSGNSSASGLDNSNDYVKLLAVAGSVVGATGGKVSEPATMALFGLAVFGAVAASRRRNHNAG
jgi:hypothetical protein